MTAVQTALEIFRGTLERIRGDALVDRAAPDILSHIPAEPRIWIAGAGKASAFMAAGILPYVAGRVAGGLIVTKDGHGYFGLPIETIFAGHPLPDQRSIEAGERMIRLGKQFRPGDHVLFMLSGGASALLESLRPGWTLETLRLETDRMMDSGATIQEINRRRAQASRIKAGGLGRLWNWPEIDVVVLSDVQGDDLTAIGSGPFFGSTPESRARHHLCGNEESLRRALMEAANASGLRNSYPQSLSGQEASAAGREFAARVCGTAGVILGLGETTVQASRKGKGGRAQEAALASSEMLAGTEGVAVLVAGSDGTDGPTDAAGAVVDGATWGPDAIEALRGHNAYPFLDSRNALVRTGPTGSNIADVWIGVNLVTAH